MKPDPADSLPLPISTALAGQRLFVTGATGFLGKVFVEKMLWSVPDIAQIVVLVRERAGESAQERLETELLRSPAMARLRARHQSGFSSWMKSKLLAVAGDLEKERFGLGNRYDELVEHIDRVVACAATVTFDERLDRAVEVNALGALRTLELARDAGDVPLLHVSTCFVSGRRRGHVAEGPGEFGFTMPAGELLAELEAAAVELLHGAPQQGGASIAQDRSLEQLLVARGAELASANGFSDVYTFTKALSERLLEEQHGEVPLAILRPAVVESAVAEPRPGWIEGVRVADPLLAAYGRGLLEELPGSAEARLEVIPVDFVAHAMIAALAELPAASGRRPVRYYQISSSRNAVTLGELLAAAHDAFTAEPLRDELGEPIPVSAPRFVASERFRQRLETKLQSARSHKKSGSEEAASHRVLEHFAHLLAVYGPYLGHEATYDDTATRSLFARLTVEERQTFPFDVEQLDWHSYLTKTHVPGLVRFALCAEGGDPLPHSAADRQLAASHARGEFPSLQANSLYEFFRLAAESRPDAIALQICRRGRWLRYRYREALTATANIAACMAQRHGIGHGDRVVLWTSGCPEWVLTSFALFRLGAVAVPLDPQWPADEVQQAAAVVGAKLICAAPRLRGELRGSTVPVVELAAPFVPEPDIGLLPGAAGLEPTVQPEDLASILFTSGTTVAPKAVPLTHANYLANVRDLVPLMQLSQERLLSVLPVHHVFEQMVGMLVPMTGASTISYVEELKPQEISWMMGVTRPTVLVAVPRLLELLHGGIQQSVAAGGPFLGFFFKVLFALSKLSGGRYGHRLFNKVHQRFGGSLRRIATGGSALDPDLGRSFYWMGFQVAEGYGMTETAPVLTVNPWGAIRFGSVGKVLPSVEVDLRPLEGEANGSGEIWVRGPNVMSGYFGNPEATAGVMDGDWLNTGDVGHFDEDGYLHVSGRTKDLIVTSAGKNVYPEEVERRYRDLPHVQELVVCGLPAAGGRGEIVSAVVVPDANAAEPELQALREALQARSASVPSYQQIGRVEIWHGELPKTTTLKVKRARLRQAVIDGECAAPRTGSAPTAPTQSAAVTEARGAEEAWVLATLARLTRARAEALRSDDRLVELGVDSLTRVELVAAAEEHFGMRIDDESAMAMHRVRDVFDLVSGAANGPQRPGLASPTPPNSSGAKASSSRVDSP